MPTSTPMKVRVSGHDVVLNPIKKGGLTIWVGSFKNEFGEIRKIEWDENDISAFQQAVANRKQRVTRTRGSSERKKVL